MMPPQVRTQPPIEPNVETLLSRHLNQTLRACGFDIRDSADCGNFLGTLQKFIRYIAKVFSQEIEKQLQSPDNIHTRSELTSWTISEVQILQTITFNRLERLISTSELAASGLNSIDCGTASGYTFHLSELYRVADAEWKSHRAIEPASSKAQKKRKFRLWAPYFVTILWPQD